MKITLTAIIKAKPEHREELLAVLQNMQLNTRNEAACLLYDLHEDITDKNTFIFQELWENQEGLDYHNQQPYIAGFGSESGHLLAEPTVIYKMHLIG